MLALIKSKNKKVNLSLRNINEKGIGKYRWDNISFIKANSVEDSMFLVDVAHILSTRKALFIDDTKAFPSWASVCSEKPSIIPSYVALEPDIAPTINEKLLDVSLSLLIECFNNNNIPVYHIKQLGEGITYSIVDKAGNIVHSQARFYDLLEFISKTEMGVEFL